MADAAPGIRRKRARDTFRYVGPDGSPIRDDDIRSLAVPPAWTDGWICPKSNGHIQATGRDAKGRKQYRYHPRWREVRDETKFTRMLAFGAALPNIRGRVDDDLGSRGLPREKVLATVVRLLETTLIRVGNDEYARDNRSFGLTTMRDRHVDVDGSSLVVQFEGKSGKKHRIDLRDRRLASIVKRCRDIPGYELFQYVDEEGQRQTIDSSDVNEYLREISGEDFTAKDFRTWAGTVLAALALQEFLQFDSNAEAKRNVVRAVEQVARRLGNTATVCRKSYIHPAVIDSYLDGTMLEVFRTRTENELRDELPNLSPEEATVMTLLRQRLARELERTRD
ncbi:MAG: DNA topoisomerase IB [Dehalococcoidia bacterium]|nr:DNA topoisomerase IB [Dehalococcoidia bacterium]